MKNRFISYSLIFLVALSVFLFGYVIFFRKPLSQISISLGSANTPFTQVNIQGREYPLEIDFGSKFQLTLSREILKDIVKKPYGILQGRDAKGMTYDSPAYIIKKIKIGGHNFENVIVKEVNEDYVQNTMLYSEKNERAEILKDKYGVIGRALLEKMNLLLDFPNLVLIECDDISKLRKIGYSEENLIKIPFEVGRTGPILIVDTDFGRTRLSLDTGSSMTFIRSCFAKDIEYKKDKRGLPYIITSSFVIEKKNFGNTNVYLFDFSSELHEIDGALGMDFLINHILYIDYRNKFIYIGESEPRPRAKA